MTGERHGAGERSLADERHGEDPAREPTNRARTSAERRVAGVLLAAGSSQRMGRDKLSLKIDGESLVRRAARTACEGGLDPVIVVTGAFGEAVERELDGLDCVPVFNPDHASGLDSSRVVGVGAVPDHCSAAVVLLADMPFVTAGMVRDIVICHRETGAFLVVSRYGGRVSAPPVLYDRSLFAQVSQPGPVWGAGAEEARPFAQLADSIQGRVAHLDWPADRLRDVDTLEDYQSALRELAAGPRQHS